MVSKALQFTQFRRKYLRPFYLPFLEPIHGTYVHASHKRQARKWAHRFNSEIKSEPASTVVVRYDHSNSPPTYGDFFIILMIARFVSKSGFNVKFEISDLERVGSVWAAMSIEMQDLFVLDQIRLAQEYLDENCQIKINGKFSDKSIISRKESESLDSKVVEVFSSGFYKWAPYFLHLLIKKHNWEIPSDFLLKAKMEKPSFRYVTWNIRRSIWASHRDTDSRTLIRDYLELRKIFEDYSIVILSNRNGLEFAFKELAIHEPNFALLLAQGKILAQPDAGFQGAIDWILCSDFYFQRSGGGMGVIAIFSTVPYVMFSIERTSFYGHYRNRKIAPWSSRNQIFRRLFLRKNNFPISRNI